MHIEISAGGLRGGVAVASFQSGMKSYISGTDGMISSFKAVRTATYNLNGGVGSLSAAVGQVNSRINTEENRKSGAETVQKKTNDFLDLAMRVDKSVASMVKQDRKELYSKYPNLKPSPGQWVRNYLSDAWNWLCGIGETIADGVGFVADSIRKIKNSISEMLSNFMQEHKIIGSILLIGLAVGGVIAFAVALIALGVPAAIAGVLVAIFGVVSIIGEVLNISDLWGQLEGNSFLQKVRVTANSITGTALLIVWLGTGGSVAATIYGVSSAILGITTIIDTWVTIDNDFYKFMKDVAEVVAFVSGIISFGEKVKKFIDRRKIGTYNAAGSKSVKEVESVTRLDNEHSVPTHSKPNSVIQNYQNGVLESERYFDGNGNPYLDIDYTDHGNPKMHPDVPHEHSIDTSNGFVRERRGRGIDQ